MHQGPYVSSLKFMTTLLWSHFRGNTKLSIECQDLKPGELRVSYCLFVTKLTFLTVASAVCYVRPHFWVQVWGCWPSMFPSEIETPSAGCAGLQVRSRKGCVGADTASFQCAPLKASIRRRDPQRRLCGADGNGKSINETMCAKCRTQGQAHCVPSKPEFSWTSFNQPFLFKHENDGSNCKLFYMHQLFTPAPTSPITIPGEIWTHYSPYK